MAVRRGRGSPRYRSDVESGKLYRPEHYLSAKPENRMFVWPADLKRAKEALGLVDL